MDIIYANTEAQYIETTLKEISESRSNKIVNFAIRIFVALIFGGLCLSKVSYDMEYYQYLREASSLVLLVYIVCGTLWIILLPSIWWKIKSMLIVKQIKSKKMNFEGDIKLSLQDDSLIITTEEFRIKSSWEQVLNATMKKSFIVLNIKGFEKVLIPITVFKTEEERAEFISYINEKIQPLDEDNIDKEKEEE